MIKIGYPIGSQYNTNMREKKPILNHSDAQLTCRNHAVAWKNCVASLSSKLPIVCTISPIFRFVIHTREHKTNLDDPTVRASGAWSWFSSDRRMLYIGGALTRMEPIWFVYVVFIITKRYNIFLTPYYFRLVLRIK